MPRIQSPNHSLTNPCLEEQNITYKCFNDNNFDREKCIKHMENYQYCKNFWGYVQSERRRKGQHPYLPEIKDRESEKAKYLETFLKKQ